MGKIETNNKTTKGTICFNEEKKDSFVLNQVVENMFDHRLDQTKNAKLIIGQLTLSENRRIPISIIYQSGIHELSNYWLIEKDIFKNFMDTKNN